MKRDLFILCLLALFSLTACGPEETNKEQPEPPTPPTPEPPALTLTSVTPMQFGKMGGSGEVSYEITNPTQTGVLEIELLSQVDWVRDLNAQTYGKIFFEVDINATEEARSVQMRVSYEDLSFEVAIQQEVGEKGLDSDFVRDAVSVTGHYYGLRYSSLPNYYINFSNVGYDPVTDYALPNGWFYTIDCYSKVDSSEAPIRVPEGTYTLDPDNTCADGTFSVDYSQYKTTDEEGKINGGAYFEEGTMEVTADGFVLYLTDTDGKTHKVTSSVTDYALTDESKDNPNDDPEPNPGSGDSNMTEDYVVDTTDWEVNAYYIGNYFGNNVANWVINLRAPYRTGDAINLDLLAGELGIEKGLAGTYTSGFSLGEYTFLPGEYNASYTGCWYLELHQGIVSGNQAPLHEGTIEIVLNDDGTYTFIIEALDNAPNPNTITVNWTGEVNIIDYQ